MKTRRTLRLISMAMLVVAIIFVLCAVSSPSFGQVIYLGNVAFGSEQWRICYAVYVLIMVAIFIISLFMKKKK